MILDLIALVSALTAPVLAVIELDAYRMERHIREALKVIS